MPQASSNGLSLEYETFGASRSPAVLLIMGLGAQMTLWPDSFCRALSEAGYFVIRYDNRDVGLSTQLDSLPKPRLMRESIKFKFGLAVKASYTLDDMAIDAIGLLDALKIERAHIVGASMGGMISQILGARFPDRVVSLTLIMTSSGHKRVPGPKLRVGLRLVKRPTSLDREALIDHSMQTWKMIASPGFPVSDEERRERVRSNFERAYYPRGVARHTMAIFASADRSALLPKISAPTLIIHGKDDVLVPVAAAYDLAERIKGSSLEVISGMGHDLPEPLVPRITTSVLTHIEAAAQPEAAVRPTRRGAARRSAR